MLELKRRGGGGGGGGAGCGVSRPSSERDVRIYRLAVPVLKKTYNLVISSRRRAGTAKKCPKIRDVRAKLLFC